MLCVVILRNDVCDILLACGVDRRHVQRVGGVRGAVLGDVKAVAGEVLDGRLDDTHVGHHSFDVGGIVAAGHFEHEIEQGLWRSDRLSQQRHNEATLGRYVHDASDVHAEIVNETRGVRGDETRRDGIVRTGGGGHRRRPPAAGVVDEFTVFGGVTVVVVVVVVVVVRDDGRQQRHVVFGRGVRRVRLTRLAVVFGARGRVPQVLLHRGARDDVLVVSLAQDAAGEQQERDERQQDRGGFERAASPSADSIFILLFRLTVFQTLGTVRQRRLMVDQQTRFVRLDGGSGKRQRQYGHGVCGIRRSSKRRPRVPTRRREQKQNTT